MSERYPHLFSPLQIGPVTARNRIMQTAHVKLFTIDGIDSLRNVAYQVERAKGGAGLLITGNRLIHPTSTTGMARFAYQYLKGALEIDRKMTSGVHEHGALIFAQLNHFGLNATSDSADDLRVLWGPSAVKSPAYGETPKAMEHEDIAEVVEWWARSAELARDGGFDGTEVHIAHSYLLHQFLSPVYNKRDDEYGGSLENRLRFTREVIDAVRERTGDDWAIGIRLTLSEFMGEGALDIEDAKETVRLLESWCKLDFVNVTAAGYHNIFKAIEPSDVPDGFLVDLSAQVKATTDLPVFTIGGIKDPALAEEILAAGRADMVAMTRAQIADPEFANKAREGREDEITHCIRGNQGCIGRVFKGLSINCTVNPGRGPRGALRRRHARRRPIRRGAGSSSAAGPPGMRAAVTLTRRGHEVTLVEAQDELGGQINLMLEDARPRDVRQRPLRPRAATRQARRRRPARDARDAGAGGRDRRRRRAPRHRRGGIDERVLAGEPARERAAGRPLGQRRHGLGRAAGVAARRQARRRAGRRRLPRGLRRRARCCSTAATTSRS